MSPPCVFKLNILFILNSKYVQMACRCATNRVVDFYINCLLNRTDCFIAQLHITGIIYCKNNIELS